MITKKPRKLAEYYHFNIQVVSMYGELYPSFTNENGETLPSYKEKLTPAQWAKAKQYLTRELRPFIGYSYELKAEYKKENAVYKIR